MTARTASWPVTTGQRWRKCFSTSRAAGFRKRRHERTRFDRRDRAASHQRDDPSLLVSFAVVMAAAIGTALLAGAADRYLGVPADLHRPKCRVFRAPRPHLDPRPDPVGHSVPPP